MCCSAKSDRNTTREFRSCLVVDKRPAGMSICQKHLRHLRCSRGNLALNDRGFSLQCTERWVRHAPVAGPGRGSGDLGLDRRQHCLQMIDQLLQHLSCGQC